MRSFKLNKNYSIDCDFKDTEEGFKHIGNLFYKGKEVYNTYINYLNRTWECYEYQSIILKIIDNYFIGKQRKQFITEFKNRIN